MKRKKIVDVKGPAVWGPVVAKRGDHLKVYAYEFPKIPAKTITMVGKRLDNPKPPKPKYDCDIYDGFRVMTKGEIKKANARPRYCGVYLHLTRKDAQSLKLILEGFTPPPSDKAPNRILNKLKREGIK